jgi:3-oxoacyl-[acyl-carrier-protein] synthase I
MAAPEMSRNPRVSPVAITAVAAVSGMGRTTAEVLSALDRGQRGLSEPELTLPFPTLVGAVPGDLPPLPAEHDRYDTRLARIGMMALRQIEPEVRAAIARWGRSRVAILIGTSTGGLDATELAYEHWAASGGTEGGTLPASFDLSAQHDFNALGDLYARVLGTEGPVYVVSTACSSSGKVHASAMRLMRAGLIDAALVGGIDSLCRMTLHGFRGLGILAEGACKPFAADRSGIDIGEGAALMLLERDHPATRGSETVLLGVGESSDAYNMSSPEPTGRGAREAMERALAQAGMHASDVGLVIAHGTATPQNDVAEGKAIEAVLGTDVPVVSTKGYTGHQLGAAGATSGVFAVHALTSGRIPASVGADPIDPAIPVSVATEGRAAPLRLVLANAFAFGGSNVCLAIGKRDA